METKIKVLNTHQMAGDTFYNLEFTDARGTHTDIMSEALVTEFYQKGVVIEGFPDKAKKDLQTSPVKTKRPKQTRKRTEKVNDWVKTSNELKEWLDEQDITYSLYGDDTYDGFEIQGFSYNLSIYIDQYYTFSCSTTHKQRFKETDDIDEATANHMEPKTLKGVKGYITKWIEL